MVVCSRRRHLPHTPPHPAGSDGSLSPKMPDSVPPPRKRRHPSPFQGVALPTAAAAAAAASGILTARRISAGGGSCGSVRSSHSGFRGSAARANHKLLCVWEARRLVLLYIAADMLRLHYVTLPMLQGRGPEGERAQARPQEVEKPALGSCLETPRTCSGGCGAGDRREDKDPHKGEGDRKMEADTRVLWPQAKEYQCYKNLEERETEETCS
ncbi:PREDICTED: uncharacterized protein LOC109376036 [Hipposideros armiger]|uniref:Uncharacterized protein LOC109376036 n=1 Tax=Hipposideros armiger TaxID=186990 RepID=A0A8B7QFZ8_HIPAR|nr:PREDICTED: uncharacterized protein LOC109376036 [Hipposideros armiger]